MMTKIWKDALHLKHALRCIQQVQPINWHDVLLELRKSRRYRKQFLREARGMLAFKLSCTMRGIPV